MLGDVGESEGLGADKGVRSKYNVFVGDFLESFGFVCFQDEVYLGVLDVGDIEDGFFLGCGGGF